MALQDPPSTGKDTDDALLLASQAVASLTARGVGATTHPPQIPVDHLYHNPWNRPMTPAPMPLPSLNTTALPFHGVKVNGAKIAQSDDADSQRLPPSQLCGNHDESKVKTPDTNGQRDDEVSQQTGTVGADATVAEAQDQSSSDDLSEAQTSEGTQSRTSSESEDDLDRLDKYAFNCASQAYDHRLPQHLIGGTTIFAEKVTMGTSIYRCLELAEERGRTDIYPDPVPSKLEMKHSSKAVECIWVGILPTELEDSGDDTAEAQPNVKTTTKGQKKTKKVQSVIDLEDDQLDVVPHDPRALRVVAKKQNKPVKLWHLYALATSDYGSKLCQGWKVPHEDVFFFKAFRDDTVAGLMKRRHATDNKIKAVTFPAMPKVAPQVSPSLTQAASQVSDPATPATGSLPTPEASGQKEKSSRASRDATAKQSLEDGDGIAQGDDHAGNSANIAEDDNSPVVDKEPPAGFEPKDLENAQLAAKKPELIGTVHDDGDEDAYPEHAVSSTSSDFKDFLDDMLRNLSVVEPEGLKPGQKRKRVAFDPGCDEVANSRRKTGGGSRSDTQARDGEDDRAKPSSFVTTQQVNSFALKLKGMVNKLVAKQDVAGLRQCVTMMECIEKRGSPDPTSALAPYLSTSSKKDADPRNCNGKLREILVSSPSAPS